MEVAATVRLRVELKAIREQVKRMAEEHKSKKGLDFDAAWFSATEHCNRAEVILDGLSVQGDERSVASGSRDD